MSQERHAIAWPILFTHRGTILGNGFLAEIELKGRLIATPEVEGVWLYGVNPGALAVSGRTLADANVELRNTLTRVFIDFAEDASTFDAFKTRVEQFFDETDSESVREWEDAVKCVRAGNVVGPEGLIRADANEARYVNVTRKAVEAVTPKDNPLVKEAVDSQLAAAA